MDFYFLLSVVLSEQHEKHSFEYHLLKMAETKHKLYFFVDRLKQCRSVKMADSKIMWATTGQLLVFHEVSLSSPSMQTKYFSSASEPHLTLLHISSSRPSSLYIPVMTHAGQRTRHGDDHDAFCDISPLSKDG
jgi:hypothetical protein